MNKPMEEMSAEKRAALAVESLQRDGSPKLRAGRSCASCVHCVWEDDNPSQALGACYLSPQYEDYRERTEDDWCLQWEGDPVITPLVVDLYVNRPSVSEEEGGDA